MESHSAELNRAEFRFYQELGDFLPEDRRGKTFVHRFKDSPSVKDTIEALGVPHAEVDLILVNGASVGFGYRLSDRDRVAVYPVFESFDISPLNRLRPRPLRDPRFILDVHLGVLARYLRILGFDALYERDYEDGEIVRIAAEQRRIILTRDVGLLKRSAVTHGYWVRSQDSVEQTHEVVARFDLRRRIEPFTRCPRCNGVLRAVAKEDVFHRIPPRTREAFDEFFECASCGRLYWKGSHVDHLRDFIDEITS